MLGVPSPSDEGVARRCTHALSLFDRILAETGQRGLPPRDRLDAQSLLWSVVAWRETAPPLRDWPQADRSALRRYRSGAEPL